MKITIIILLIFLWFVNYVINKFKFKISVLFHGLWTIILILHYINLCGFYPVGNKAYIVVAVGILGFDLGALLRIRLKPIRFVTVKEHRENDLSEQVLMGIAVVYLVVVAYLSFQMFKYLQEGFSYGQLRAVFQGYDTRVDFHNSLNMILNGYFLSPMCMVFSAVMMVSFFERRYSLTLYTVTAIDISLYLWMSSSRFAIFQILIFLVLITLIYRNRIDRSSMRKIYILFITVIVILGVATSVRFATRKSSFYSTIRGLGSFYVYLCGNISLLDIGIKNLDYNGNQTYGLAFFHGIYQILNAFLGFTPFGKTELYSWVNNIMLEKEKFHYIASGIPFNAFYTIFYDFYLDFRITGVFGGSVIYGIIGNSIFDKMLYSNSSTKSKLLGMMFSVSFVMSTVRWHFLYAPYIMAFIYIEILFNLNIKIKLRMDN